MPGGGGGAFPKEPAAPASPLQSEASEMDGCSFVKMPLASLLPCLWWRCLRPNSSTSGKTMTYMNCRDQNRRSEFAEIRENLLSPAYF